MRSGASVSLMDAILDVGQTSPLDQIVMIITSGKSYLLTLNFLRHLIDANCASFVSYCWHKASASPKCAYNTVLHVTVERQLIALVNMLESVWQRYRRKGKRLVITLKQ